VVKAVFDFIPKYFGINGIHSSYTELYVGAYIAVSCGNCQGTLKLHLQSYKAVLGPFVPKYFGCKSLRNAEVVFC